MNNLYSRENMLDHLKNPRNKGKLVKANFKIKVINRHCGDILYLYADVKNGRINKITFEGEGCAVSMSSASMLLESLQNTQVSELCKISRKQVLKNFGEDLTPSRQGCALLVLNGVYQLSKELTMSA